MLLARQMKWLTSLMCFSFDSFCPNALLVCTMYAYQVTAGSRLAPLKVG